MAGFQNEYHDSRFTNNNLSQQDSKGKARHDYQDDLCGSNLLPQ